MKLSTDYIETMDPKITPSEWKSINFSLGMRNLRFSARQVEEAFGVAVLIEDEQLNYDDHDFADYLVEVGLVKPLDWDKALSLVWIIWGIMEDREVCGAL